MKNILSDPLILRKNKCLALVPTTSYSPDSLSSQLGAVKVILTLEPVVQFLCATVYSFIKWGYYYLPHKTVVKDEN